MPTLIAGPAGLDMGQLDVRVLLEGTVTTRTSTSYVEDYFGQIIAFVGQGFAYDAFGYPTAGTVTGLQVSYQGQVIYQITGASNSVSSWESWANNGDTLAAFQGVLGGADTSPARWAPTPWRPFPETTVCRAAVATTC
jgi:hypothetical protein